MFRLKDSLSRFNYFSLRSWTVLCSLPLLLSLIVFFDVINNASGNPDWKRETPFAQQGGAVVGDAPDGANALEFLARSDQDGTAVTHYGYLTHISDLPDESLFSHPVVRTEATARFTFSATTKLTARHLLGNIIATAAVGKMTIYFNQAPGADFNNPASFANGQPIATFSVRFQNILNVQSPDSGESTAVADLTELQARSFTLDGRHLRLGQQDLPARLFATGRGTRTQVDPPKSSFFLAGNITVTKPKSLEPDR